MGRNTSSYIIVIVQEIGFELALEIYPFLSTLNSKSDFSENVQTLESKPILTKFTPNMYFGATKWVWEIILKINPYFG